MPKFEYRIETVNGSQINCFVNNLNKLGELGWQVCCRLDALDGSTLVQLLLMRVVQ